VDVARPQGKRVTLEHLEKESGARKVDSELQVQLEEDRCGSTNKSWMESTHL